MRQADDGAEAEMTEEDKAPLLLDPDEPFENQLEWLANRYNPGYFLGGTLRPELRVAALGWHAKRVAGALAVLSGVAALGLSLLPTAAGIIPPDPWSLGFGVLSVLAGLRIWEAAAQRPAPERIGAGEARRLVWVAAVVGLGVVVLGVVGIVVVAGVSIAVAISRGEAGLAAALCVVIAIVAIQRARRRPTDGSPF